MEVLLLFMIGELTSITCFLVFNKGYMYMIKLSVAICTVFNERLQLRDPKNDVIFNFNFDDKVKNL